MEPQSSASAWCRNVEETIRTRSKPASTSSSAISSATRLRLEAISRSSTFAIVANNRLNLRLFFMKILLLV
jgi:hypothetical protein